MNKKHINSQHNSTQQNTGHHNNAENNRRTSSTRSSSRQSKISKASRVLTSAPVDDKKAFPDEETPHILNYKEHITDQFFQFLLKSVTTEIKDENGGRKKVNIFSVESISFTSAESGSLKDIVDKKEDFKDSDSSLKTDHETSQSSPSNMSKSFSSGSCASDCKCVHKIAFQNGNVYEGTMKNGVMHGRGIFKWSDGASYEGDFMDGFPEGTGKMRFPDLSTYDGQFSKGFFHGKGTLNIASSPVMYSGLWKKGKADGKGWLHYDSGNYYEGEFRDGLKHGFGYRHYKDGTQYRGEWQNGAIGGQGKMLWNNNDYYSGFWKDSLQNGYGEYVWGVINHNDFVFANYNCYKGNWVAGLMICGNGFTLQRNPLFENDKPATFSLLSDAGVSLLDTSAAHPHFANQPSITAFKEIASQVESRENLDKLNDSSLTRITKSGCDIRRSQFVKLLEKNTGHQPPLKIPVHTHTEDVDFSFWISVILNCSDSLAADSEVEVVELKTKLKEMRDPSVSGINLVASSKFTISNRNLLGKSVSQQNLPRINEESKKLQRLITNNLQELTAIYEIYATMACDKTKDRKFQPVLVRLFLWQLYWDIGLTEVSGAVSIVDADEAFAINPKSCLDSFYEPFEPIYFWQFLQALVSTSTLIFMSTQTDYLPTSGIMYYTFKDFLENRLYPNVGKFTNNCLTKLKDLVPIKQVYGLYKQIGEPHFVSDFLKETCLGKKEEVPCYKNFKKDNFKSQLLSGNNTVLFNNEVGFTEDEKSGQEVLGENSQLGLYTFGESLGRKIVLKCLVKVCPQLLNKKRKEHYRLSFIEFYEVLLTMAFEKVEKERLKLISELHISSQRIEGEKTSKIGPLSPITKVNSAAFAKKKKPKI